MIQLIFVVLHPRMGTDLLALQCGLSEPAALMTNSEDENLLLIDAIDHPVSLVQQLPDLRPADFRYHAATTRKLYQLPHDIKQAVHPCSGNLGTVTGNVFGSLRSAIQRQR